MFGFYTYRVIKAGVLKCADLILFQEMFRLDLACVDWVCLAYLPTLRHGQINSKSSNLISRKMPLTQEVGLALSEV